MADIVASSVDQFVTGKIVIGSDKVYSMTDLGTKPLLRGIQFRADSGNTGTIMIAESSDVNVTNGPGFPLLKDESLFIPISSWKKVFFKASAAGQIIWFLAQ